MEQLGFGPFFDEQLEPDERPRVARVTAEHRGAWEVQHATGTAPARLTGRLRHEGDHPGVGDWVVLQDPQGVPVGMKIVGNKENQVFNAGDTVQLTVKREPAPPSVG